MGTRRGDRQAVAPQVGVPAVPAQARLQLPDLGAALAGWPRAVDDRRGARAQRQRVALRRQPCAAGRPANHRRAGGGEHRREEQELERVHLHGFCYDRGRLATFREWLVAPMRGPVPGT